MTWTVATSGPAERLAQHWERVIETRSKAFSYAAPAAWNTLPTSLQQISNTETFKPHLRTGINRLTPRLVVYRLNVFVLVVFEFLPYLEIKLTFECTAWFCGLAPPLPKSNVCILALTIGKTNLVPICLQCSNCMKFIQLILKKSLKLLPPDVRFKAKIHQIQFRLELRPRVNWGSLQRSPRPLSWIWGAYF